MAKPFYLTTPLYYVNAKPHLGHAYTTVVADCLARARRQRGEDVFLLTGTDEHGEKIAQAAQAKGVSPKEFADQTSETFRSLWKLLGISNDHFIRTTDPEHVRIVQRVLTVLHENGALKPGRYTFGYCVPCETSWAAGDFPDPVKKVCPTCQRPVEQVTEEDFFLNLEEHRAWLKERIRTNPQFIQPESRRNEVLRMLEKELPPLCVTRPKERVSWGIEVPFSPTHVTYVWFEALLNYITALGWPDGEKFKTYWQETDGAVHLVGKDILRHHCLYWPIILHALGVEPPKTVFAHGWWMVTPPSDSGPKGPLPSEDLPSADESGGGVKGEKMSKSKGNVVSPEVLIATYGLDALRYFLLREIHLGDDGVFSEEALVKRINADLANDLGNLVYRTLAMLEKHAGGKIPSGKPNPQNMERVLAGEQGIRENLERMAPAEALKSLWELITWANRRVEEKAPWTLAKEGKRLELEEFLYELSDRVRAIALLVWPFMPSAAESIWIQLGYADSPSEHKLPAALQEPIPAGQAIRKGSPLFPRIQ